MPEVPDLHTIAATLAQMPIILAIWWLPDWCGKWIDLRERIRPLSRPLRLLGSRDGFRWLTIQSGTWFSERRVTFASTFLASGLEAQR